MSKVLFGLAGVLTLAVVLIAAGIAGNRPPLTRAPGALQRVLTYLSSNVAETGPDARFPELAAMVASGEPAALLDAITAACRELGWQNVAADREQATVDAEVVTALLRFTDDVRIRLLPGAAGAVEIRVRASSRVGRGDLGANARHVMDLRAALVAAGVLPEGDE